VGIDLSDPYDVGCPATRTDGCISIAGHTIGNRRHYIRSGASAGSSACFDDLVISMRVILARFEYDHQGALGGRVTLRRLIIIYPAI
jgi:hypothetical protein